jgi:hypothetical protein
MPSETERLTTSDSGKGCVGQIDARAIIRQRARCQPHPGVTVGRDLIVTDETGVSREDPLLTICGYMASHIGDHESRTIIDRQDWRTYADFNRHNVKP